MIENTQKNNNNGMSQEKRYVAYIDGYRKNGEVDIYHVLKSLLDNKKFVHLYTKSLRTMDLLNGCSRQCAYCYRDPKKPTLQISTESFYQLFNDLTFQKILMTEKLRIGASGDICDHPEAVAIVKFLINNYPHKFHEAYTCYRDKDKMITGELMKMAINNPDRNFRLIISIDPFNKEIFFNDFKDSFIANALEGGPHGYRLSRTMHYALFLNFLWPEKYGIFDMGKMRINKDKLINFKTDGVDSWIKSFKNSGKCKVVLNPHGLWIDKYIRLEDSPTARQFTLITPENFETLATLPFHEDFPTPQNWPGGKGEKKSDAEIEKYLNTIKDNLIC